MISKPFDQIIFADIAKLCANSGTYESLTLEFKRELPGRDGKPDPWLTGGNFTPYARDRLLREIVAFANAQGGTLILGVDETEDKPPRAAEIRPIPRVHDLAARLEEAARACIDPPLASLQVRGIVPEDTADGVVLLRTVGSPFGPHRVMSDGHAFMRRGSSSVQMTMREIQDLTLDLARGADRLDALFEKRASAFTHWLRYSTNPAEQGGFRVTAVPLGTLPQAIRVADQPNVPLKPSYLVGVTGGGRIQLARPALSNSGPILRGYRSYHEDDERAARLDILDSGVVDFWVSRTLRGDHHLHMSWIFAAFLTVLKLVDWLRGLAVAPEWEFGIEVAFDGVTAVAGPYPRISPLPITILDFAGEEILLREPPVTFPRLPSRSPLDDEELLNLVCRDLLDTAGDHRALKRLTLLS